MRDGFADTGLPQLGGQLPDVHLHARGNEELDHVLVGRLGNGEVTLRATEAVRAALIVRAHAYGYVPHSEVHIPAARAAGPNRRHDQSSYRQLVLPSVVLHL